VKTNQNQLQTGTEIIENQVNKRKHVPNPSYISNSASEVLSEETSLSSENDDNEINKNPNYISKDKFQGSKRKNLYLNQNLLNL